MRTPNIYHIKVATDPPPPYFEKHQKFLESLKITVPGEATQKKAPDATVQPRNQPNDLSAPATLETK